MDIYKACQARYNRVAPLLSDEGKIIEEPLGKASIHAQFTGVLSKPVPVKLAHLAKLSIPSEHLQTVNVKSPYSDMPSIIVNGKGVEKLLKNLNPHKAAGRDNIRPIVLKELSPIITFLFQVFVTFPGGARAVFKSGGSPPRFGFQR